MARCETLIIEGPTPCVIVLRTRSRLFERTLQRMLVFLGEIHHLRDLGFRYFIGEDTAYPDALLMDVKHHSRRLVGVHREERFQHMDDKFHGRIIVIQQQHLVLARLLRFRPGTRGKPYTGPAGTALVVPIVVVLASHMLHDTEIG